MRKERIGGGAETARYCYTCKTHLPPAIEAAIFAVAVPSPSKVPPFISRRRRRRRPTRWTPPRSADSYVVCTACVRSFARSLARSFKCFLTVHPLLAPSLLWMEGSDGASERAVHVEALADCTDWMEAGHPYGRLGWARGTSERKNKCSR